MDIDQAVKLCPEGNQDAWNMIINSYSKMVYNISLSFSANADDAADLVQEIFIKLYNNIDKFDSSKNLKAWISRVAKNYCIDHWRKNKKNMNKVELEENIAVEHNTPEETNILKSDLTFIRMKLKTLEPDLRIALVMRDIEGLSYAEISEALNIPQGTVKSRINRARIKLAKSVRSGRN